MYIYNTMVIVLNNLPKVSLNKWYSGIHWTKRKKIKDNYINVVKSQFSKVFSKDNKYNVSYYFEFKSRPLDASNCVAMVKMIEDILFENDGYKVVESITIHSRKSTEDRLTIKIN